MIDVTDLRGQQMDCCHAVALALSRMGVHIDPDAFEGSPHLWTVVKRADVQAGDVIVSRPNGRLHVAAVLNVRPGRGVALSADSRLGVVTDSLTRALVDSIGVWRYRGPR